MSEAVPADPQAVRWARSGHLRALCLGGAALNPSASGLREWRGEEGRVLSERAVEQFL